MTFSFFFFFFAKTTNNNNTTNNGRRGQELASPAPHVLDAAAQVGPSSRASCVFQEERVRPAMKVHYHHALCVTIVFLSYSLSVATPPQNWNDLWPKTKS